VTKKAATAAEVNEAIRKAAAGPMKHILTIVDAPLVSHDFNHDPHSCSFMVDQTKVLDGNLVAVMGWYDNEWGFSNRMGDTAAAIGKLI
jgi:glyceraldehyde 3-phosphate dehydrogenase